VHGRKAWAIAEEKTGFYIMRLMPCPRQFVTERLFSHLAPQIV
jgi:hypothetical protein